MTILTLNGSYFVEGQKALTDSLFNPLAGKTAAGYYTRHACRVMFHKPSGELFAAFVHNPKFTGLVTADKFGTKARYMHGLSEVDAKQFGLDVNDYRVTKAFEESLKPFVK
jgi:hypothetical protein